MNDGLPQSPVHTPAAAYAASIVILLAAVLLRWLLDPVMGDTLPVVTLFGAVAGAVWLGGYRAAIVVAILGYFACSYLFIPPRGSLWLGETANVVGFVAYLFTCALIIMFGVAMRTAQARAAERRETLRATLRSIGDGVVTTDVDGCVTYLNEVAESLTGWTNADALGQPLDAVFRIVNEATRKRVDNPAVRALRQAQVVGLANHTLLIRKDGMELPIDTSAAPIRDDRGRVSGCVLIFREVSARRDAERDGAGKLLEARFIASIVESSEVAIVSKSLDGTIRSWNPAAERLFGHTAEQAVGKHISLVIPQDRIAEEDEIIARLKAGQRIEHFETERVRADGGRVWVSLTISPVRDDDGSVIGASKMARDITRERQVEAELAAADRRKDEFLATLSHELRGPLAPLSNVLEVWKRADDPEMLRRARHTMERQLAQLVRLVDDLLDLNRITHNRLELRRAPVELAAVIEQAVEACRPLADSLGHELEVELPQEPIYLVADLARLAQVFGNLLNNACKYTNPGGKIAVTAEREGSDLVVSVKDTGTGIAAEKLDSIFEMFTQIDQSSEQAQGGLGIGLTLVKRLVQMHGGSVAARSEGPGRGSEFVVRLPALPASSAPEQVPATALAPGTGAAKPPARRILVVDDNADSAVSLAMLLEIAGNETYTAHDGVGAIEAVEKHRPEVVLLDIGLPKMSGHDVCRHLREQPWGKDLVLIALTGWGQVEDRRKSQDAGFDGHLVKPVDYDGLTQLLASLTRSSR